MTRRQTLLLLLLVLCLIPAVLQGQEFRHSTWGDSMEAVRAAETATFHHQRADELAFMDSEIDGIDGGIIYLFERGRLVRGLYVSRNEYSGGQGALADYQRMRAHFDELLGIGGEEERRWLGEETAGEADDLVADLIANRLRLSTSWTLERTQVDLIMTGKDGGVFLRAVVQPPS